MINFKIKILQIFKKIILDVDDDTRVVGGHTAEIKSAPFIVSVRVKSANNVTSNHNCGGAILDEKNILTAAHCIVRTRGVEIVAGDYDLKNKEDSEQWRQVVKQIPHEAYPSVGTVAPYDIAIFTLDKPLEFDEYVQPIKIPEADEIFAGDVQIFGWGSMSNKSQPAFPSLLQTAVLQIIPILDCFQIPRMMGTPLHTTNICTGPLDSNLDACSGDSGGPLVQKTESGDYVLVGLVSWGYIPCGRGPSVFTRVSAHTGWIETHKVNIND